MLSSVKRFVPDSIKYQIKNSLNRVYNARMEKYFQQVVPYQKGCYEKGINLIGDIQAETGLGQSMRILAQILRDAHIPFVIIQVNQPGTLSHDNHDWDEYITENAVYAVNLLHINTSEWAQVYVRLSKDILDKRYNIAYWLWELEEFPKKWHACMQTVDEIWAPSDFICDSIKKCTEKPVCKIPYAIQLTEPVMYTREYFQIPEDVFAILMMYDFKSVSERKNPKGMVEAFCTAFTPEEANKKKIGLIVKINHLEKQDDLNQLKVRLAGYQYVYYITKNLTRAEVEALVANADVLLSLHRSEGFGLPIAEAMYLGTVVVATNWSATTEFMQSDTACLVDYKMITLDRQYGPYRKGSRWADADIEQAAAYIKKLYQDTAYYEQIRENAKRSVRETLSYVRAGTGIRTRIDKL